MQEKLIQLQESLDAVQQRLAVIDQRNHTKDTQQLTLPIDEVSRRLIEALFPVVLYGNGTMAAGVLDVSDIRIKSTSIFMVCYRDTSQAAGLAGKFSSAGVARFYSTDNTDTRTINYIIII